MRNVYVLPVSYDSSRVLVSRRNNVYGVFSVYSGFLTPARVAASCLKTLGFDCDKFTKCYCSGDIYSFVALVSMRVAKETNMDEIARGFDGVWLTEEEYRGVSPASADLVFNFIRDNMDVSIFAIARGKARLSEDDFKYAGFIGDTHDSLAEIDQTARRHTYEVAAKLKEDSSYTFSNPKVYDLIDAFKHAGVIFKEPEWSKHQNIFPLTDMLYFDLCEDSVIDRCIEITREYADTGFSAISGLLQREGLLSCSPAYYHGRLICGFQNYICWDGFNFVVVTRTENGRGGIYSDWDNTDIVTSTRSTEETAFLLGSKLLSVCFDLGNGAELLHTTPEGREILDAFLRDCIEDSNHIVGDISVIPVLEAVKKDHSEISDANLVIDVIEFRNYCKVDPPLAKLALSLDHLSVITPGPDGSQSRVYIEMPEWLRQACIYGRELENDYEPFRGDTRIDDLRISDKIFNILSLLMRISGIKFCRDRVIRFRIDAAQSSCIGTSDSEYDSTSTDTFVVDFLTSLRSSASKKKAGRRKSGGDGISRLKLE